MIVRVIFISSFLFLCLLSNHSFQTNPNSVTNCFNLFSLLQLTTTLLLLSRYFDFWTGQVVEISSDDLKEEDDDDDEDEDDNDEDDLTNKTNSNQDVEEQVKETSTHRSNEKSTNHFLNQLEEEDCSRRTPSPLLLPVAPMTKKEISADHIRDHLKYCIFDASTRSRIQVGKNQIFFCFYFF